MLELADQLSDGSHQEVVSQFAKSLKNVLHDIQQIQRILPNTSLANSLPPKIKRASLLMEELPIMTSTPISVAPPTYASSQGQHKWTAGSDGSPVLRTFNNNGPSPYPMPGRPRPLDSTPTKLADNRGKPGNGVSLGIQVTPSEDHGIQTTPISQLGPNRALSPSDDWILSSKDRSDSPMSTFAPTIPSTYDGLSDHTATPPPSRHDLGSKVKKENMVQYPTSIEGLDLTPSLHKLTNQSDFSLSSDWEKEGTCTYIRIN